MKMDFSRVMGLLAVRHAGREALVNIERKRRFTYDQLHRQTNQISNMLRERLSLQQGDVYLCILENDNLSLLHVWTAFKGNVAAAFTNFRDSIDEHLWQVEFIKPKVVFVENVLLDRYFDRLRERGAIVVCMDPPDHQRDGLYYFWDLLDGISDDNPGIEHELQRDIMIYRFTGGTTGKSKCAMYTMDNWIAQRDAVYVNREPEFSEKTRYLHMAPISHGSGINLLSTLFRGGCTVTQNVTDLKQWCKTVEAEKITTALLLPTLIYWLLDLKEASDHDLSSLETIAYGGAPISPAKLGQVLDRFGNIFVQGYGASECLQTISSLSKMDHLSAREGAPHLASAGRVTPGVELMIADDGGNELPAGTTGEIWIRARGVISGYHSNPEGTASEFANGFWKSGDLGYLDERGYLYIVDRKKDMIISGGFNVYAIEVEAALNSHPAVANSAVVGIPHEEWGEAVHAEVVLRADAVASIEELIAHVKDRIARYKAPKTVTFVKELPTSSVGKILRRHVRDKYWRSESRRIA